MDSNDNKVIIQMRGLDWSNLSSTLKDFFNGQGRVGEPMYDTGTGELYIHDGTEYVPLITNRTPSSASDTGVKGQIAWDSDYIYICTDTDQWRRIAHATW